MIICNEVPKSWNGKPATYLIDGLEYCRRCQRPVMDHPGRKGVIISYCPHCGIDADGNMEAKSGRLATPKPGDYSLCWHCRGVSIYVSETERRVATQAECDALPNLAELLAMMDEAPSVEVLSVELGRRATE